MNLSQPHEDLSHAVLVHLITAIKDHDSQADASSEILGGLCLSSAGRTCRGTSQGQIERLSKRYIAAIGQWGDDQPNAVTDILEGVELEPIHNFDNALAAVARSLPREANVLSLGHLLTVFVLKVELELAEPGEALRFLHLR